MKMKFFKKNRIKQNDCIPCGWKTIYPEGYNSAMERDSKQSEYLKKRGI